MPARPAAMARGFTLLELLLVLLVIGLMTALSVAWLAPGEAPVREALARLADEARVLQAQARQGGRILGLRWGAGGPERVGLSVADGVPRWRVEPLRLPAWPADLVPDRPVSAEPWLVFTPHGVARPVQVSWRWPGGGERWTWQSDGGLRVVALP
ncbi:prepilin-type N-terminal cleavage/methylation domain-containing protein [Stutzerimonas stutzeri]|uniref:General secretion pathway protein H n=1 Tax=Stutzerimonas stutzeri KOS6 TaxID=1218352 RepID=A0A061JW75_STUST|nr:prepilin-type N-terminal cleavage/methylation domain-containing protein [Stutzerimonas stutzeri]EWC43283.1 general secretion pathway protein H [Stutzerimonas stutzeri KOS6]